MSKSMQDFDEVIGCFANYDPQALPVKDAQQIIRRLITPLDAMETVPLKSALDRILACEIVSPIDVPAHDNSAMDGYAFRGADLLTNEETELAIIGTSYAGHPYNGVVGNGECVAIMTGAVMPEGCDTVVPQELTQATHTQIRIPVDVIQPGANRRFKGEDLRQGQVALCKGKILRPADLGLLASLGVAKVPVNRRLRVAFFSTGDELRSVGETLAPGCVYDSNRYTLHGMLTRLGCDVIDLGVVRDDPDALKAALRQACENVDAIVTSGGVSVGAADYTRQVIAELGQVAFWKINMRPGRPLAFGHIDSNGHRATLFGLPGNPVAVMISFYFFARDALLRMMGAQVMPLPLLRVPSSTAIRKKPGRTEYQRAKLSVDSHGRPVVAITGAQGSGILRSMSEADCIIVLDHDSGDVAAGDDVSVIQFEGLL